MNEQESYQIGDTVIHPNLGQGVVIPAQEEEGFITVRFETGVKHLSLQYANLQRANTNEQIALIKDQMEALDECWRTIEAEYGEGPSILHTIEKLKERASKLLEEQARQ